MKAAYYERYGSADVVGLREVAMPQVADDGLLVKVAYSAVTTADWRFRASAFPKLFWLPGRLMAGLFAPRINVLGRNFSGHVVAVGKDVTQFQKGDAVFGVSEFGAHAEYVSMPADGPVHLIPDSLGFDAAAAVPFGALAALVFLRDFAQIKPGQNVLVMGASGGVGVYLVQLAKLFGAHVTGVSSAANLDLVRGLGADQVLDYAVDDFSRGDAVYDVIIDTVGATTFAASKPVLSPNGVFVPLEFQGREIWQALMTRLLGGKRVVVGVSGDTKDDLAVIAGHLARGDIRPVIGAEYSLDQIAQAHKRVESRHKTGAVVVNIAGPVALHLAAE